MAVKFMVPDDVYERVKSYARPWGAGESELVTAILREFFLTHSLADRVTFHRPMPATSINSGNTTVKNVYQGDNNSQWFSGNNIAIRMLNDWKVRVFPESGWSDVLSVAGACFAAGVFAATILMLTFANH